MKLNDTNRSFDNYFTAVDDLLDTYAQYKKLSLREIKLKTTMVDERYINVNKSKNKITLKTLSK